MTVTCESGKRLSIPCHHPVYTPLGDYRPGDRVDPETVDCEADRAALLGRGRLIIVDNLVETVAAVRVR